MAGRRQLSGLRISQVLRIRYVFELKRQWLRCIEERRQGRLERRWIESARFQPGGLIIGLPVALAGIADQRHQRSRLIRLRMSEASRHSARKLVPVEPPTA